MTRDGERVIELISELGSRVSNVLSDVVPARAQTHLLNAQRELITALMLIYEHQATGRRTHEPAARAETRSRARTRPPAGGGRVRGAGAATRRTARGEVAPHARRVRKIDID